MLDLVVEYIAQYKRFLPKPENLSLVAKKVENMEHTSISWAKITEN